MSKIIKLGMMFDENNVPDFGSIEKSGEGQYTLLAKDIEKLNSKLTKTVCAPLLESPALFDVHSGSHAIVADYISAGTSAVYRYHSGSDKWYEVISNE